MSIQKLPDAYPLYWPEDWKRTPSHQRQRSRYDVNFVKSRDTLGDEVRRLGARKHVITSCMQLRMDGLPLANQREPADPGVAVWWLDSRTSALRVMACDKWLTARENMHAVAKAIEAIRSLERCGASQILDRVQESFAVPALPGAKPWWFERLKLTSWPPSIAQVHEAFRTLARVDHPDVGGTHERFVELQRARDAAVAHQEVR